MTRTILLFGTTALLASAAGAQTQAPPAPAAKQQPAQQQGEPPTIHIISRFVVVPVTVKDNHGQLVGDLTKSEFRIFADGVEQKVDGFSAEAVPLSAVILLDNDLNERVASQVQKSLTAISAGFGPDDETALVTYDEYPETVSDFSSNNDLLFTTLKRLELGTHNRMSYNNPAFVPAGPPPPNVGPVNGGAPAAASVQIHGSGRYKSTIALNDAIFAAGEMLKTRGRNRRKIIFLISDETNAGTNAHSFEETLRSMLVSDVSIYSISVTHSVPVGKKLVQKGAVDLEKYTTDTGGDRFYAAKQTDLERLYSEVTEQARNEYTLTFSPEEVTKGQDYHPIEVRVRRPELNVEAREGYYESAIAPGR